MALSQLKIIRMTKAMTQFELASKLGVSEKLISWWETGRGQTPDGFCFQIARIFDVEPGEIWPKRFSTIKEEISK